MLEQYGEFLNKKEVSEIMGMALSTVSTLCSRSPKNLPKFFKVSDAKNSPIRFRKQDVIEFIT